MSPSRAPPAWPGASAPTPARNVSRRRVDPLAPRTSARPVVWPRPPPQANPRPRPGAGWKAAPKWTRSQPHARPASCMTRGFHANVPRSRTCGGKSENGNGTSSTFLHRSFDRWADQMLKFSGQMQKLLPPKSSQEDFGINVCKLCCAATREPAEVGPAQDQKKKRKGKGD